MNRRISMALNDILDKSRTPFSLLSLLRGENGKYVLALLVICLVVRLIPAYLVFGSFDVGAWKMVILEYRQKHNPYITGKLNWPPLWPLLLYYTKMLEDAYNLPPHFSVKIIPCVADCAIAIVLYAWFTRTMGSPASAFKRSLWYGLNPVAIATCALHGQFESLPCLFSLLAILSAECSRAGRLSLRSAFWLSLGGMAKTWPLILTPACLQHARSWRRQTLYVLIAFAPAVLSTYVLYLMSPKAITKYVLQYHSNPGYWGLTSFNFMLPRDIAEAWSHVVMGMLCVAWLILYKVTWRHGRTGQITALCILTFYVFTPGWGVQYLVWILAIAMVSDLQRLKVYTVLASVCLAIFYIGSPFNGEFFDFLRRGHTHYFWATYLSPNFFRVQALLFLPLWLYCLWWWASLLRDVKQGDSTQCASGQAIETQPMT